MQTTNPDTHQVMKANFYRDLVNHFRINVNPNDYKNFPHIVNLDQLPNYTVPSSEIIKLVDTFNIWYPKRLQTNLQILFNMHNLTTEDQVTFVYQTCVHLVWLLKAYFDLYKICRRYITEKDAIQILKSIRLICRNVAYKTKVEAKRLLGSYQDMNYDVETIYTSLKSDLFNFM